MRADDFSFDHAHGRHDGGKRREERFVYPDFTLEVHGEEMFSLLLDLLPELIGILKYQLITGFAIHLFHKPPHTGCNE